jgi:hypothetical protein
MSPVNLSSSRDASRVNCVLDPFDDLKRKANDILDESPARENCVRQLVEAGHDPVMVKAAVEAAVNERLERAKKRRSAPEGPARRTELDLVRHLVCVFAGVGAYLVSVVFFNLGPAVLDPSPAAIMCFFVGVFVAETAVGFIRG